MMSLCEEKSTIRLPACLPVTVTGVNLVGGANAAQYFFYKRIVFGY